MGVPQHIRPVHMVGSSSKCADSSSPAEQKAEVLEAVASTESSTSLRCENALHSRDATPFGGTHVEYNKETE